MSYPALEVESDRIILLSPVACSTSTDWAENDFTRALSPVARSTLTACDENELSNVIILRYKNSELHIGLIDDGLSQLVRVATISSSLE